MTSPLGSPPTRDLGPNVLVPLGCITSSALRDLANTLDRLAGFHEKLGGQSPDAPCLVQVLVEKDKHVHARILSNGKTFDLQLVGATWEFR